jgi:hypothetical protein
MLNLLWLKPVGGVGRANLTERAKDPYSLAMAMARKGKDLTTGKVTLYSDETIFGKCVATKREVWFFLYIRGACVVIHTASK